MAITEQPAVPGLPRLTPRKVSTSRSTERPPITTPTIPPTPDISRLDFVIPSRRILSRDDHHLFLGSDTKDLILSFIFSLSDAAAGNEISSYQGSTAPDTVNAISSVLGNIESLILTFPPEDQGDSRFGNPAFRPFLDAVERRYHSWHTSLFPSNSSIPSSAVPEISTYLFHSLGNRTRVDYGSGHELNFVIYLLCLNRLGILPPSTFAHLALMVLPQYVRLMRKIQSTYYLEPAGSHGVWGLDDYQFLPFLIGAAQLKGHKYITPKGIHNEILVEEEGDEYLYFDMVRYTTRSKTVRGLAWTQPMLNDISTARHWGKVEQGMRRMFMAEVLGKLPVMQHFLFGCLIPAVPGMTKEEEAGVPSEENEEEGGEVEILGQGKGGGHVHQDVWGDCCGIKIPSSVVAITEEDKRRKGQGALRRVPFD